jgi:hypothetical protein
LEKALAACGLEIVAQSICLAGAEWPDLCAIKGSFAAEVGAANEGLLVT